MTEEEDIRQKALEILVGFTGKKVRIIDILENGYRENALAPLQYTNVSGEGILASYLDQNGHGDIILENGDRSGIVIDDTAIINSAFIEGHGGELTNIRRRKIELIE